MKHRSLSSDKRMIFLYSTISWPSLEPTQATDRNSTGEI